MCFFGEHQRTSKTAQIIEPQGSSRGARPASIPLVKDTFFISIDLANKTEDDFNFLLPEAEVVFRCFMDDDLLDQSVQKLRGQLLGDTDLLDQLDPLLGILNRLLSGSQFGLAVLNFLLLLFLLLLISLGEHIKVAFVLQIYACK